MREQKEMFLTEYEQLQQGQSVHKNSTLSPLQLYISDELIRVSGRLCNSYLPLHSKHQVITDKTQVNSLHTSMKEISIVAEN